MGNPRGLLTALLFVLGCEAVGIAGALTTSTDTAWYQSLEKPPFQPPGWLFGPVWTVLYALMGVAAYRVFASDHPNRRTALLLFVGQLVLNGIWSPIFFGAQAPAPALAVIATLLAALTMTVALFWRIDRPAGLLLVPYLMWVGFATVLNGAIVQLN